MGDRLALHQNQPESPVDSSRQVLLLHGLGGCHRSGYMIRTCRRLLEAGFAVWRLDARGSGAGVTIARYHHHAGRSEDVQAALEFVANKTPGSPVTVAGFSLGANVVLNWLTSRSSSAFADSAIAVAPPANLVRCSENLQSGFSRAYDLYFARMMMRHLLHRRQVQPDMIDVSIRRTPESLRQFDSLFTAPAGGFADLDDYYGRSSTIDSLDQIAIPTLVIVDETDPVIPVDMFDGVRWPSCGSGRQDDRSRTSWIRCQARS